MSYVPTYSTSATFVVTSKGSNNIYANLSAANTVASSLTKIFDSDVLKKKVAMDIGTNKVPGSIKAEVIPETNLFVLKVSAPSPDITFRIITSVIQNYTSVTNHVFGNAILDVLEAPSIPMYPDNFLDTSDIMKKAFLIGMAAMFVLLAVLSVMRDNVKNEKDVTKKLDTKLFGVIYHENKYKTLRSRLRKSKKSILITSPTVSFSFVENFKKMRTKLEYKASQNSHKVILVTSTLENEGKSTLAANLALALAQKSKNILLIDGDLYNPSVYKILEKEVESDQEIGECMKKGDLTEALTFDEDSGMYLMIGSRRYENSADLIVKDSFMEFIKVSKKMMDYIIIDAPPIIEAADTEVLADLADASLLVVRQSTGKTKDINDAIDILSGSNSELLGCVYNNVRTTIFGHRLGYDKKYYKGYYGNSEKKPVYER
jgi:capsular exopolysaccharide synthesis family protein